MTFIDSGVAVVTGAGSGIGRALAQRLSAAGSALALADLDEKGLTETAASLTNKKAAVTTHVLDVSDESAMRTFAEDVLQRHGRVTLLINNAGVALIGTFEEISLDDFRWLMDINFWGTVYGARYFLPILKQQPRAHIVNLSSVFGLIAPVGQSAYSSSKFAVRGFTECLRHELEGTSVFVSCVHPGGIHTPIAKRARLGANVPEQRKREAIDFFEKVTPTSPEAAAARILKGVEKKELRILIGPDARQIDIVQRLKPATYWKAISKRINSTPPLKK
ncbi:MAG TPA: SDR family NAD(P)-dependent oxidoreductase [Candidatus Acidoferrum sp.]|nr:SDR family NAD(P)-dependent oxidoreductase [Candidatus Acidoferrum sp.]